MTENVLRFGNASLTIIEVLTSLSLINCLKIHRYTYIL